MILINPIKTKLLSLVSIIFILATILILYLTPPANGYEISIYQVYPWYMWYFMIISIFIGQIVIITNAISKNKLWLYGIIPIILNSIILFFMPFVRGYTIFGRWDELVHLGYLISIINTGHIGVLFYPALHILTVIIHYTTTIPLNYLITIIPAFFSLFLILVLYVLSREISNNNNKLMLLLIFVFSTALLYGHESTTFAPSSQAFVLLPFILFLYFKSRNEKNSLVYRILLVLSSISLVFFHPETTIFLITTLMVMELLIRINLIIKIDSDNSKSKLKLIGNNTINIILILFITFFFWYFSVTNGLTINLQIVLNWLLYNSGRPDAALYSSLLSKYNIQLFDLIKFILYSYGQVIILSLIALLFSFYTIRKLMKGTQKLNINYVFFSLLTLLFSFLSIIFFFNDFIIGYSRVFRYLILFTSILTGIAFYELIKKSNNNASILKKHSKNIALYSTLFLITFFAIFNFYWSPIIKKENQQVSKQEITGMNWIFDNRNITFPTTEIGGISYMRMYDATYGTLSNQINIQDNANVTDHFGYNQGRLLGSFYPNNTYLFISTLDRISYPTFYPNYEQYWKFTPSDFENLDNDPTVSKIYDNHDMNIYLINP